MRYEKYDSWCACNVVVGTFEDARRFELGVYVFHDGWTEREVSLIRSTLEKVPPSIELTFKCVQLDEFAGLRKALGSSMNYVLFKIPELVDAEKILYIDVDVVVRCDLSEFFDVDLTKHTIAAVSWCTFNESSERQLFNTLGFSLQSDYFNTGVVLINRQRWLNRNVYEQSINFAHRFNDQLISCDQPVINTLLHNDCLSLPRRFNTLISPKRKPLDPELLSQKRVWHLLGRPKPWDLFGEFFHHNSRIFINELDQTAIQGYRSYRSFGWTSIKRFLRYHRDYLSSLRSSLAK